MTVCAQEECCIGNQLDHLGERQEVLQEACKSKRLKSSEELQTSCREKGNQAPFEAVSEL